MNSARPTLPSIPDSERTPFIDALLEFIQWQSARIADLEDEVQSLKQTTRKPRFKPSGMDEGTEPTPPQNEDVDESQPAKKQRVRRKKKSTLPVHAQQTIEPDVIPRGSRFKGYRDIIVQDLIIRPHNVRYRLAQYETPDGHYVTGQLPEGIRGGHWGSTLHSYILYQYHHQHVTQPLLLEQLRDFEVDISSGQLSNLITEQLEGFHTEKDSLLQAGLEYSRYIHADDTGARHAGKTGYCTHIGNELFAWFKSTESKSRINFLALLQEAKQPQYVFNAGAIEYMGQQRLPQYLQLKLEAADFVGGDKVALTDWLVAQGITGPRHQRIIIEGALMGGLLTQGIPTDMAVISDDAGQFNVFDHALCWIHAERLIYRLIPLNEQHKAAVKWVRSQVWALYRDLKAYKLSPDDDQKQRLRKDFIHLFQTRTTYETLNQLLKRLGKNEHELLRVLDRPELPLHNNLSERDIRDYVKKRKISGSTRSENGRRCRDTFASLKKTCRKHGQSFWEFLKDRASGNNNIPPMAELIQKAACEL